MTTKPSPTDIAHRHLRTFGTVTFSGLSGLAAARALLQRALQTGEVTIRADEGSDADIIDYLVVGVSAGLQFAPVGLALGALLGALLGHPAQGAAIGAGLGFVAGAKRGVDHVRAGWRVRAVRHPDGTPQITISTEVAE